jgi:hypothetical protein
MELKYKVNKIRDLIAYKTNMIPEKVELERHYINIYFNKNDRENIKVSEKDFTSMLSTLLMRNVKIFFV